MGQFLSEGQEVPDPGRDHASVLVQRQGKKNKKTKKQCSRSKAAKQGEFVLTQRGTSLFVLFRPSPY